MCDTTYEDLFALLLEKDMRNKEDHNSTSDYDKAFVSLVAASPEVVGTCGRRGWYQKPFASQRKVMEQSAN